MKRTKIDWCDSTWNPVTGCLHGCEYCYARRIAKRFDGHLRGRTKVALVNGCLVGMELQTEELEERYKPSPYPYGFKPTLHKYRLEEPQKWRKPKNIFVCSMADLFGDWVPDEWIDQVIKACIDAPQHRYLFLTKNPKRYAALYQKGVFPAEGVNGLKEIWLGSTMTAPANFFFGDRCARTFVSIEPITRPFSYSGDPFGNVDWIIVGAETGNRKNKVIPKREWITEIAERCQETETPIFMKESLRTLMGSDFRQEFPWKD